MGPGSADIRLAQPYHLLRDPMPNAPLSSFSLLAQERAVQSRNCANEPELRAWLDELLHEKLDGEEERAKKAKAWCSTVGRKYMLREGACQRFSPSAEILAASAGWLRDAMAAGKTLVALSLDPAERELFSSILDWMRSASGPSLRSDWSKISVPQAKAAELAWIDAMGKAAANRNLAEADAEGTELFGALGPTGPGMNSGHEWSGWRWVDVKSEGALDREGSLMRHCVGSYARDVAAGGRRIFSLRDPSNAPKLTVEARGPMLVQIKAFANAACPAELRSAVADFANLFEADAAARGLGVASASSSLSNAGVSSFPGLGLFVGELSGAQEETLRVWTAEASDGSEAAKSRLGALIPSLAGLGLAANLGKILPFASEEWLADAFCLAIMNGQAECLDILSRLSLQKGKYSQEG